MICIENTDISLISVNNRKISLNKIHFTSNCHIVFVDKYRLDVKNSDGHFGARVTHHPLYDFKRKVLVNSERFIMTRYNNVQSSALPKLKIKDLFLFQNNENRLV